jgi:DNA transposition AAA+ family ATPase
VFGLPVLYGGDGLGNTVVYEYYVSTIGESWYYTENTSTTYNTRIRPFAYNINNADKTLYNSYYFVDT